MEYLVIARKWRPQQFDDVVGQEHVTTTLKNAIDKVRVGHAYIFTGPRGIGKTSTARILAKALNCVKGPTATPCDKCPSCEGIIAGNSMDVLEIDGASNRGIDQIRELRENVKFAPSSGKYKIYIIDEVHQITSDAFNALLKTLEEPPSHVKFFFATTEPHKVPATILSRCQRFDLRVISPVEIVERLSHISEVEKIKIDKSACFAIARYAHGSMRDAESILDQLVSFSEGKINEEDVISMLGLVRESILREMTDALIQGDCRRGLEIIASVAEEGKELPLFLADWISYLRSIMLVLILGESEDVAGVSPDAWSAIVKQSRNVSKEQMLFVLDILTRAEQQMKWSLSPRIFLELSYLKAATVKDRVNIGEILEKIHSLEKRLAKGGCGESVGSSANTAESGAAPQGRDKPVEEGVAVAAPSVVKESRIEKEVSGVSVEPQPSQDDTSGDKTVMGRIGELWHEVLDRIAKVKPLLKSYLVEGSPARCEDGVLFVEFDKNFSFHRESLEHARNKQLVKRVLSERLGRDIGVKFEIKKKSEGKPEPAKSTASRKEIKDLKRDPLIQSAIAMFNAQVVDVKK